MIRLVLVALALAGCASASTGTATGGEQLNAALREQIHSVRVATADAQIVVTTYRPHGAGPD